MSLNDCDALLGQRKKHWNIFKIQSFRREWSKFNVSVALLKCSNSGKNVFCKCIYSSDMRCWWRLVLYHSFSLHFKNRPNWRRNQLSYQFARERRKILPQNIYLLICLINEFLMIISFASSFSYSSIDVYDLWWFDTLKNSFDFVFSYSSFYFVYRHGSIRC